MRVCSVDSCFLIDWAKYRRRWIIEKIFSYCYIVEEVVAEIKSERSVAYLAELLAKGFLVFYPFKRDLEGIVREVIAESVRDSRVRTLDPPEAYALAIGVKEGCVVLTENKGVIELVRLNPKYAGLSVWRSYELLREASRLGLIESLEEELKTYESETGHKFPRKHGSRSREEDREGG